MNHSYILFLTTQIKGTVNKGLHHFVPYFPFVCRGLPCVYREVQPSLSASSQRSPNPSSGGQTLVQPGTRLDLLLQPIHNLFPILLVNEINVSPMMIFKQFTGKNENTGIHTLSFLFLSFYPFLSKMTYTFFTPNLCIFIEKHAFTRGQ